MENWILKVELLKKMPKIAVIDTGINLEYRDFNNKNIEIVDIIKSKTYGDLNGHGTSCCGEIIKYNPKAELVILPVLNENCTCSLEQLYYALLYCNRRNDIGIINLSLSCGIDDQEIIRIFHLLVTQMYEKGKILIVSNNNIQHDKKNIYPYNFKQVIGVTGLNGVEPFIVFDKFINKCCLSDNFYFMPNIDGRYKIFYGNSSLTAKMTGLLSGEVGKLKKDITLEQIIYLCNKRLKSMYDLENNFYLSLNKKEIEIVRKHLQKIWLLFYLNKCIGLKKIIKKENRFYNNVGDIFLKTVEKQLGFKFDFKGFSMEDLKFLDVFARKCLFYRM